MRDIANLLKTKTVIAAMCDVFNVYDAKRCIVAAGCISAGQDPASLFEQDEAAGRDSLATVAKIKQLAMNHWRMSMYEINRLFYPASWPHPFDERFQAQDESSAAIALDLIDYLIADGPVIYGSENTATNKLKMVVAVMRSGEFPQVKFFTTNGVAYCAIGLICELYRADTGEGRWVQNEGGTWLFELGDDLEDAVRYSTHLPPQVLAWLGLTEQPTLVHNQRRRSLMALNDEAALTFVEIASLIEAQIINT